MLGCHCDRKNKQKKVETIKELEKEITVPTAQEAYNLSKELRDKRVAQLIKEMVTLINTLVNEHIKAGIQSVKYRTDGAEPFIIDAIIKTYKDLGYLAYKEEKDVEIYRSKEPIRVEYLVIDWSHVGGKKKD